MKDDILHKNPNSIEEAWYQEAERRYQEFLSGKAETTSAEIVLRELRGKYGISSRNQDDLDGVREN